jgi:hypothetical protein
MAAFLIPLLTGALEGFTEKIKQDDEVNAATIQEKLKSSYTARLEKKKELDTERAAATKVVNSLRGIEFADGPLDNSQLINIATKPKLAESILKKLDDDPEWFKKTNRGFIRQVENVDPTIDINKHFDSVYRLQKEASDSAEKFFAAPEDASFLDKRNARKNLIIAKQTAAKLGVSLEDLMATYKPSSSFVSNMGRVDPSALSKPEDFDKMEKRLKSEFVTAQQSGDPKEIAKADANIGKLILLNEKMRLEKKSEAEIQSDLITDVQTAQAKGTPQGKAEATIAEAKLKQRKILAQALPTVTVEKTSQSNWITIANGALMKRMEELIPGKFIPVVNLDTTISMTPKGIGATEFQAALAKAKNEIVIDFTSNGAPKSDLHRNALMSIGVGFRNGKAVVGGNVLTATDIEAQKTAGAASTAEPAPAPVPAPAGPVVPASTPSGRATPTPALPLPYTPEGQPDTSKLIAGKTYRSSTGGTRKWNGTSWEQ